MNFSRIKTVLFLILPIVCFLFQMNVNAKISAAGPILSASDLAHKLSANSYLPIHGQLSLDQCTSNDKTNILPTCLKGIIGFNFEHYFICKAKNIVKVVADFKNLWQTPSKATAYQRYKQHAAKMDSYTAYINVAINFDVSQNSTEVGVYVKDDLYVNNTWKSNHGYQLTCPWSAFNMTYSD